MIVVERFVRRPEYIYFVYIIQYQSCTMCQESDAQFVQSEYSSVE